MRDTVQRREQPLKVVDKLSICLGATLNDVKPTAEMKTPLQVYRRASHSSHKQTTVPVLVIALVPGSRARHLPLKPGVTDYVNEPSRPSFRVSSIQIQCKIQNRRRIITSAITNPEAGVKGEGDLGSVPGGGAEVYG